MPNKKPHKSVELSLAQSGPVWYRYFIVVVLAGLGQYFLSQADKPSSLWFGLLFFGIALWEANKCWMETESDEVHTLRYEAWAFTLILALGLFLRLFRIDSLPAGMHTDQGLIGFTALKIAREGFRPFFELLNFPVPETFLYYQVAAFFKLFGASYLTFHVFFALLSIASFPLIYWTFRQLSGPRVALLALFILSVMRWNWTMSRNGYPSIQTAFYLFGCLAFGIHGLKERKLWALVVSALFCGAGLYTYQAFKAVPFLLLALAIYEYQFRRRETGLTRRQLLSYFLLAALAAAPLLGYMARTGNLGNRERELFILTEVIKEKSLMPVVRNWTGTPLMFNRSGDMNSRHNIPGRRMLDDVSGALFVLGLGLAWRRRRDRTGFYPLAGLFVMSLPCLLSTDIAHANRIVCITPFVAYFAATALDQAREWMDHSISRPLATKALLGSLLAIITLLNGYTYFVQQAQNEDCLTGFGPEQNYIGRKIERLEKTQPGHFNYFITTAYEGNLTVSFLGYPAKERTFPFLVPQDLEKGNIPRDRDAIFILEQGKSGTLRFLKTLFPDGQEERLRDQDGQTLIFCYQVPRIDLTSFKRWHRGLRGSYLETADWSARPLLTRWDPILNFTHKRDFPFTQYPPFRVLWKGMLRIDQAGNYRFQLLTTDKAQLYLDGEPVTLEKIRFLKEKRYPIMVRYEKDSGDDMALHLAWKKPGDILWEVIPAENFGKTK